MALAIRMNSFFSMRKWLQNDDALVCDGWNQSGATGLPRIAFFAYFQQLLSYLCDFPLGYHVILYNPSSAEFWIKTILWSSNNCFHFALELKWHNLHSGLPFALLPLIRKQSQQTSGYGQTWGLCERCFQRNGSPTDSCVSSFKDFVDGEVLGLVLWGLGQCCLSVRKHQSHWLLISSLHHLVFLHLCKGPLGRDVQVGDTGTLVTHVTALLVFFNPVTVRKGWAGAAQLSSGTEDDEEWEEATKRRRENSHLELVLAISLMMVPMAVSEGAVTYLCRSDTEVEDVCIWSGNKRL